MDDDALIRGRIDQLKKVFHWTENSISGDSATQKRLNRQLSHGGTITLDTILLILDACPEVSADWLLLGRGEMLYKETDWLLLGRGEMLYKETENGVGNCDQEVISRFLSLLKKKDEQMDRLIEMLSRK